MKVIPKVKAKRKCVPGVQRGERRTCKREKEREREGKGEGEGNGRQMAKSRRANGHALCCQMHDPGGCKQREGSSTEGLHVPPPHRTGTMLRCKALKICGGKGCRQM